MSFRWECGKVRYALRLRNTDSMVDVVVSLRIRTAYLEGLSEYLHPGVPVTPGATYPPTHNLSES